MKGAAGMASKRHRFAQRRKGVGFTQESLAERLHVERSTVARWETGETQPLPWMRPKIACALQISVGQLGALLIDTSPDGGEPQETDRILSGVVPSAYVSQKHTLVEPISDCDIGMMRDTMRQLLAMDAQFGGMESSRQGLRLFRSVQRRIGVAPCSAKQQPDLYAAVGELAEIVGWLLYDADDQDGMRQISHEALMYLQWAGDKNVQLLTLQNLSMHAEYLRRPAEALVITHRVLETEQLSPRLESLFRARRAHALAQQRQDSEARRELDHALSLFYDGVRDDDPAWAWWIDERQFNWFKAMIATELGNQHHAVEHFAEALNTTPAHRVRGHYSYSVYLTDALTRIGAWSDAEKAAEKLSTYIAEVGSGRTTSILKNTLRNIGDDAPPNTKELKKHLITTIKTHTN